MSEKVLSLRERLRAKTIEAAKNFRSEEVEYEGEKFIVRQPSVAQRSDILKKAKAQTEKQEEVVERMDLAELQVWATIHCVYTPEGERVFDDSDADALRNEPAGGFVDTFSEVALQLMNMAEEAAKNSVTTPSGNSSSKSRRPSAVTP